MRDKNKLGNIWKGVIITILVFSMVVMVQGDLTLSNDNLLGIENLTISDVLNAVEVTATRLVASNEVNASDFYDDGTNLNNKYVDEAGDTMSGSLDLGTNDLTNVGDLNTTVVDVGGGGLLKVEGGVLLVGG